jgi:excisionase family DNA binding protein
MEKDGHENSTMIDGGASDELLTLNETLSLLSISKQTLYRMLDRGELFSTKVGRQRRFRRSELQAYLERGPVAMALSAVSLDELDAPLENVTAQLRAAGEDIDAPDERISNPVERAIARLLVGVLRLAVHSGASDIHFEPIRESAVIRLRIDGVLHEALQIPTAVYPGLIQRLKVLTEMNVDERRLPQDGRLKLRYQGRQLDLRVCVIPSFFGESAVARILDQSTVLIGLERLHFFPDDLERLQQWNHQPRGLILLSGPTGSGKTTVMYVKRPSCIAVCRRRFLRKKR